MKKNKFCTGTRIRTPNCEPTQTVSLLRSYGLINPCLKSAFDKWALDDRHSSICGGVLIMFQSKFT